MGPKEYFKISKEVAQSLYDKIEAEIKEKLLTKYNSGTVDNYYELIVSDELKGIIESNLAIWNTVVSMYKNCGWRDVYYGYTFSFTKKNRKLKIIFINSNTDDE